MIGLSGTEDVLLSKRISGSAAAMYVKKTPLRQRDPLSCQQVVALDMLCKNGNNAAYRAAAGCFAFMVYGRCRLSDVCRVKNITFDLDSAGHGYIEASAIATKTASSKEKRSMFLPLTAVVFPLSSCNWAVEWQLARTEAGLDDQTHLLPAPSSAGTWSDRPISAGEASRWLKDL